MTEDLISVVLPVHNQGDYLEDTVRQYLRALARIRGQHELILVVNGSRDRSLALAQGLAEQNPEVRVVHTEKAGWGLAVRLGLAEARGDLLCYTNSARTKPQDLALFVLYALAFPGVVIKANRKIRDSWVRRLGSLLYNLECRALFDLPNWDVNGTPKIFPRSHNRLLRLTRDDDLVDAEFCVICRSENYQMLEVPIVSPRRVGGKSTTGLLSAARMYRGALQMWRTRPRVAPD